MTPEQQIKELQDQVETLMRQMREFTNEAQLDPQIIRALGGALANPSGKSSASGSKTVVENGSASYSVMKAPDGFIRIGDFDVPYIN